MGQVAGSGVEGFLQGANKGSIHFFRSQERKGGWGVFLGETIRTEFLLHTRGMGIS